ncbi:Protein N-lysine methyltransferase METTL21A [Balamuthia mandrillaris]
MQRQGIMTMQQLLQRLQLEEEEDPHRQQQPGKSNKGRGLQQQTQTSNPLITEEEEEEEGQQPSSAHYAENNNLLRTLHQSRMQRLNGVEDESRGMRTYMVGQYEVKIKEAHGLGLGSHVWEGTMHLFRYICKHFPEESLRGKRVIELGAGCGLLGISMKRLAMEAQITLTDKAEALSLLRSNVERNNLTEAHGCFVRELSWGDNKQAEELVGSAAPFDLIVASDVIFDQRLFEPLINSILRLSGPKTKLLISYRKRCNSETAFFHDIANHFEATRLHRVPSKTGKGDVVIFNMQRRRYSTI